MKELPENQTLAKQIDAALKGRVITEVFNATKYHKNTFYMAIPSLMANYLPGEKSNLPKVLVCM